MVLAVPCQDAHGRWDATNVHPNDAALTNVFSIYNNYSSSGKTGGSFAGYTSLIPVAYDNVKQNSVLERSLHQGRNRGRFRQGYVSVLPQGPCLWL